MSKEAVISELMNGGNKLPTLPGIAMRILEAVRRKDSDLREIADVLSTDPPLSAEVLKIINSPFYGLKRKVASVPHAVNLLGANTVKNLALSFSLVRNFNNRKETAFDYALYWKNSLIAAIANRFIVGKILPDLAEEAFFLGLLHDIGILCLSQRMPKQFSLVLQDVQRSGCTFHETENQVLGFNHMEVGEYLARSWGLPDDFAIPIGVHHCPQRLETRSPALKGLTRSLHLASLFTDLIHLPDKSLHLGMIELYLKQHACFEKIHIEELTAEIQTQTKNVFPLFEIKMEAQESYTLMIEEARKELIHLSQDFLSRMLEQKRQIEMLQERATHDGLTNLTNYQTFHEQLEKEVYRSKRYKVPLAIILADIDHFKRINDNHGHLTGDYALQAVSKLLKEGLRASDSIARYGGEEFAVIMPETAASGAMTVAERLRNGVASTVLEHEGQKLALTMSFGVADLLPGDDSSKTDLLKKADQALYRAKNCGRNKCCLYGTP